VPLSYCLPVPQAATRPRSGPSGSNAPPLEFFMANILIADDYDDNRELLRLMLESAGHEIREARDGLECVCMAFDQPPDILLVDLSMPLLDGWAVLRELRRNDRTRLIPCVAVSAFSEGEGLFPRPELFNAYVSKPYRSQDLIDIVGRLLGEQHAA
jgi:two-component system cell cycle response regulator DivK